MAPADGLFRAGCGNLRPNDLLGDGFVCGTVFAVWAVACLQAARTPSRASACCHVVLWAGSVYLRPDGVMGSGFASGQTAAAWDAQCEQLLGTLCKTPTPSVWWRPASCSQHLGLVSVCSFGVLGAAQRNPDPLVEVGRAPTRAHWDGHCVQAAGNRVTGPMLPGWWIRS